MPEKSGRAEARSLIASDVAARTARVVDAFGAVGCQAMLVTKLVNVRWLTGFTGSNACLLVADDGGLTLITDGRYRDQAGQELDRSRVEADLVITRTPEVEVAERIRFGRLAVESHDLSVDGLGSLRSAMHAPGAVDFVEVGPLIDALRQQKDPGEIDRLRLAAAIADRALWDQEASIRSGGLSERELARSLETSMFEAGADGLSFETIVASGENSARPHARPTDRIVSKGDLVVIDFGAAVDGYGSDMTRTFVVGGEPTEDQVAMYDLVEVAQQAGVDAVAAGADQRSIDRACRDLIVDAGHGDHFVHGTGHGIGLEIHEQPILSERSVGILAADLVVTVEPGVYVPGIGGVRIEDSVVVTDQGCEPITHFPKGLAPWQRSRPTT